MTQNYQKEFEIAVACKDLERRNHLLRDHDTEIYAECSKCEDTKPVYQFYRRLRDKYGIRKICICCDKSMYRFGKRRTISAMEKEKYKLEMCQLQLEMRFTDERMLQLIEIQKLIIQSAGGPSTKV